MDSYGLSKVCNEKTARAFAMRYKADIYALRIGNVIEPHEYRTVQAVRRRPADAASATPGATSTRAISARSSACASRRTGSASRSSTRPTTRSRSTRRPEQALARLCPNVAGDARDGRVRGAAVEPQGARGAGLQGGPRLAQIRPAVEIATRRGMSGADSEAICLPTKLRRQQPRLAAASTPD